MAGELDPVRRHLLAEADQALHAFAELVLGEAGKYVLEDEGTLAASGHVEPEVGVEHTATGSTVLIVYSTPYAARRHEELDITPSMPGRQPKWLERAMKENIHRLEPVLAAIMRKGMG